jgi:hypothetical protein
VSQRTRTNRIVRRINVDASVDYIENAARTLVQNKQQKAQFGIEFQNSDQFRVDYRTDYELLPRAFGIATGGYGAEGRLPVRQPQLVVHHRSAAFPVRAGELVVRVVLQRHAEVARVQQRVHRTESARVVRARADAQLDRPALRPLHLATDHQSDDYHADTANAHQQPDAVQREPAFTSTSVRLNWEYQPSSQFFLVYSDGRDTLGSGVPDLLNRSFAAKITRLLRF